MRRDPEGSLLEVLRTGPKDGRELLRLSGLSKRTLYHRLGRLERDGRIAVFPVRMRDRWASLYTLPEHAPKAARLSGFEPFRETSGPGASSAEASSRTAAPAQTYS